MENKNIHRKDSKSSSSSSSSSDSEKKVKNNSNVRKVKSKQEQEEIWKTYREMPSNGKWLFSILTFGLIFTAASIILGAVIEYKSTTYVGRVIIAFSALGFLAYIYGGYAVRSFLSLVETYLGNEKTKDPEEIDQSRERVLLNIFFYLELIMTIVFLLISCICFFFGDEVKSTIDSWYVRPEKWEKYFGDVQYNTIMDNIKVILYITGGISSVLFMLQCLILHLGFKMIKGYRAWQVILQFICVMFYISGFILIYLAVFALRYKELSQVDQSVPEWLPITLIVTGAVAVMVGIMGYVASYMENNLLLKVFTGFNAVFCLAILVFAIFGAVYANDFKNYFEDNCYDLMDGIDQQYLADYLHCPEKYVQQNEDLAKLQCPKDRIAQMWEINKGKDADQQEEKYGCLSKECCISIYASIKNKFNYLVMFGFLLFGLGILNLSGGIYMVVKLEADLEEGVGINATRIVLAVIVLISTALVIFIIVLIPPQPNPTPMELAEIDEATEDSTEVNPNNVIPKEDATEKETEDINEKNQQENEISTDESKCTGGACLEAKFSYTLSATNGTLERSAQLPDSVSVLEERQIEDKYVVRFEGGVDSTKDYLKYFTFKHKCQMSSAFTHVYVSATGQSRALLQLAQTDPAVVLDSSKLKQGENIKLIDTFLSYTLTDETKPSKVRLSIKEKTGSDVLVPAEGAKVELSSKSFPNCLPTSTVVGTDGVYLSNTIYQLKDQIFNEMTLKVTYKEYEPAVLSFGVGGIGSQELINLSPLEFVDPTLLIKVDLNTKVINTTTNTAVEGASVTLYKNRFSSANSASEEESSNRSLLELRITEENTKLAEVTSGSEGEVSFNQLSIGEYTIVTKKDDFYSENMFIQVKKDQDGNLETIALTPKVSKGGLRFVLSWPNGPEDLDVYAGFQMNRFLKCQVFFGRKRCGGLELDVDNYRGGRNGVETITMETLGKYQYLFTVNKYVDISNGIAPGENRDPNEERVETEKVPDLALAESNAVLSIYNDEFEFALAKLTVPSFATAATVMDPENIRDPKEYNWWVGFCLDGSKGLSSLRIINKLSTKNESYKICADLYK